MLQFFLTWVGSLNRVLGGGQPPQRDVPGVPADLWQATVRGLRILQGETRVSVVPRLMVRARSASQALGHPGPGCGL